MSLKVSGNPYAHDARLQGEVNSVMWDLMRWPATGLVLAVMATGCGVVGEDVLSDNPGGEEQLEIVPDEMIVLINPGTEPAEKAALFEEAGVTEIDNLDALSASLVSLDPDSRESVRAAFDASDVVEESVDNEILEESRTPGDPLFDDQWHHELIGSEDAWNFTTGDEDIIVAVLDSGVDDDHEDLEDNLAGGESLIEGVDSDDSRGHGTAVAGIIGAMPNNRTGGTGMAWNCTLLPIRVSNDKGQTTSWDLALGIALAAERGAKVINISFAPLHNNALVLRQARQARLDNRLVIISSGNTGKRSTAKDDDLIENALFVSAISSSERLSFFSTTGNHVDLSAPGQSITTTDLDDEYDSVSGTSFAAPVVSGVAALIWSLQPDLRVITVQDILLDTAVDLGEKGRDDDFGEGRVDAAAALAMADEIVEEDDDTRPTVEITSPSDGARVGKSTKIRVTAKDNVDVADVTLYVDGVALATDVSPRYQFYLNATRYDAGEHVISAVATDTSGNTRTDEITLEFTRDSGDSSRPSVQLVQPGSGDTVRGVITVLAEASDNKNLASAELLVDGKSVDEVNISGTQAAVAINWNTTSVSDGSHEVSIRITDTSGNTRSDSVTVSVNN